MSVVDRPDMPYGYGISASDEGQLEWPWVEDRLVLERNYWVCSTGSDGRPHAMPVWGVWLQNALFFSTDPTSTKGRNLAARPDVVVHLESGDEVVVVRGRVKRVGPDELPKWFVDAYNDKYDNRIDTSNPAFGFYRLRPERVLAWREKDFPTSATRFRFGSRVT